MIPLLLFSVILVCVLHITRGVTQLIKYYNNPVTENIPARDGGFALILVGIFPIVVAGVAIGTKHLV